MSFSSRVKEELSRQISPARHCQIAETAAILSLCGRVQISAEDRYCIKIHTENVAVARKYFTLLKKTFNIVTDVTIRRNVHLKKNRMYTVAVRDHEDAYRVLQAGIHSGGISGGRLHQRSGEVLPLRDCLCHGGQGAAAEGYHGNL